jgi:hypothetical protein
MTEKEERQDKRYSGETENADEAVLHGYPIA